MNASHVILHLFLLASDENEQKILKTAIIIIIKNNNNNNKLNDFISVSMYLVYSKKLQLQ